MKTKIANRFWEIECTQHMKTIFRTEINSSHLSENGLKDFMRALFHKYALTDIEILEEYRRQPFKATKTIINIVQGNNYKGGVLSISFSAQVADICVTAWLTYETG